MVQHACLLLMVAKSHLQLRVVFAKVPQPQPLRPAKTMLNTYVSWKSRRQVFESMSPNFPSPPHRAINTESFFSEPLCSNHQYSFNENGSTRRDQHVARSLCTLPTNFNSNKPCETSTETQNTKALNQIPSEKPVSAPVYPLIHFLKVLNG